MNQLDYKAPDKRASMTMTHWVFVSMGLILILGVLAVLLFLVAMNADYLPVKH